MRIPDNIYRLLREVKYYQLATSSKSGTPNVCTVGAIYEKSNDRIIIVDNYFNKTIKNILENPKVSILFRKDYECFQIKGKCEYKNRGGLYKKVKRWQKAKSKEYPAKGIIIIKPTNCYDSRPGKNAGKEIE